MRRLDAEQLRSLEETSREYEIALMEAPAALSYLSGRGISTTSIDRFRLGLASTPPAEHRSMRGRLAIPTIKRIGITGFKYRCIQDRCITDRSVSPWAEAHDGHPKYVTYEPQAMYNTSALDNGNGAIAICEGEFDAIILDGECGIPAIALPGTESYKGHPHWRRLLRDFKQIWIFADNDAGKETNAGLLFGRELVDAFPQATLIELPSEDGKSVDVNSYFCRTDRKTIREMVGLAA